MKQLIALTLILFFSLSSLSQNKKFTYFQFDISAAIRGNPDEGVKDQYTQKKGSWLIPDGVGTKLGYGLHHKQWIALGMHTGINWEWTDKLVVAPVFANFKLSPKVGADTRITLQLGYGKAIALGRGSLMGEYKKASLGVQTGDDVIIFVEVNHYTIPIYKQRYSGNISLGIALVTF